MVPVEPWIRRRRKRAKTLSALSFVVFAAWLLALLVSMVLGGGGSCSLPIPFVCVLMASLPTGWVGTGLAVAAKAALRSPAFDAREERTGRDPYRTSAARGPETDPTRDQVTTALWANGVVLMIGIVLYTYIFGSAALR